MVLTLMGTVVLFTLRWEHGERVLRIPGFILILAYRTMLEDCRVLSAAWALPWLLLLFLCG